MNVWNYLKNLFKKKDYANDIFEKTLSVINEYLEEPYLFSRKAIEEKCAESVDLMMNISEVKADLSENDFDFLNQRKIDAADFCAPFFEFPHELRSIIDSILNMQEFISKLPQTKRTLKRTNENNCKCYLLNKKIDFLSLNHFALESKLTSEEIMFFKEMLKELPTYNNIAVWETNIVILQVKIEKLFQDYEKNVSEFAESVGGDFSDYLNEKKIAEERLSNVGFTQDEFEKMIIKIEQEAQISQNITRIERIEKWKQRLSKQ